MKKKKIKCPCCGSRIMDSNEQVITVAEEVASYNEKEADYFIKCKVCKKEIRIKKVSN
jgi:DNA-directed RNA polymerase subunit RPC12/RpoP